MRPITWVIDTLLLEKHDEMGFPTLADAAREQGDIVFTTKYVPFSQELVLSEDAVSHLFNSTHRMPTVAYGTVGFIRQFQRTTWLKSHCPGCYLRFEELKFSKAAAMYGALMLNNEFTMLPYGELRRRILEDNEMGLIPPHFYDHRMFVRPDVVTKTFAGRVFDFDTEEDNIYALDKYEKIDPAELVVIADPTDIISECRHFVVNGKVVAESQYRRNNVLDIRIDVAEDNHNLAVAVAEKNQLVNFLGWEPDTVYVVDTAETVDGPRIIEFNSASCSGLYACDTRAIVKAVNEQAWKELNGDLD
jgi:ATP-grasp domain, R2K clade family 3